MPNTNPFSARMTFQWKYVDLYTLIAGLEEPRILNIGCADDPLGFGELAHHYDLDDWSYRHKRFTRGDAHQLPFEDGSFDLVIMGDIHEHLIDPLKATLEAARVVSIGGVLAMSIFEEWRLPGFGQWVQESHQISHEENVRLGYEGVEDYQAKVYPERVGVDNTAVPHLNHINQFTDNDIRDLVNKVLEAYPFMILEYGKAFETFHEGRETYNWLIALRRKP